VGFDIDQEVIEYVRAQKINFILLNLETDQIPYPDEYFDLVTCFGVLEHLRYFDHPIQEANRVLKQNGFFLITIPNLASWIQRITFTFGYQPRDVEISNKKVVGRPWFYEDSLFGHIHSATLRGIKDLLNYYGFKIIMVKGGRPLKENPKWKMWAKIADAIFSKKGFSSKENSAISS
jgi:SAM-dependent methyltransferase